MILLILQEIELYDDVMIYEWEIVSRYKRRLFRYWFGFQYVYE